MKTADDMIALNREQARYYDAVHLAERARPGEGYVENRSANLFTRIWAALRYRQQQAVKCAGIESKILDRHHQWVAEKKNGRFLEMGCFSGGRFTFKLAELAQEYVGIDLSQRAVEELNRSFRERGLAHKATARAGEFLSLDEPQGFDLVYAQGVLHHFENPEPLFARLQQLLRPDGRLIFTEPSAVNRAYSVIRACYRPFQSDALWEWPFRRTTVRALGARFDVLDGFGWGRRSLPVSVCVTVPGVRDWMTSKYVNLVHGEVIEGFHARVWKNSYVTATCRPRCLPGR